MQENGKITLRGLEPADKNQLTQLANNKKIWENVSDRFPYPYTEEHAEAFIKLQSKDETEKVFAIEYEREFCGCVGLKFQKDVYHKSAEVGYWIGEPFWDRSIATRAVELLVRYAFEELKLNRVFASAFEYNVGSMRVLEKNGFQKEGIAQKAVFKNNNFWDEHRYALVKKE
ncbi:GNAT family protein [uncultured Kriegella sp.]|uniref:GNAT family N-acetyltransferase n=1 Tax=uncultured Kriegella sp. TaxID=1798910 RepID=UPI0030DB5757|tara:strand:+ start:120722 stop:121237 length:516 start_codon:yes stop_codon:yes gene_type:complete